MSRGYRTAARIAIVMASAIVIGTIAWLRGSTPDDGASAIAHVTDLKVALSETGVLRSAQSFTYRSPLAGREAELVFVAPEGTYVQQGDLIVRLDNSELQRELQRAIDAERQAGVELRVAVADREEASGNLASNDDGEKLLDVEEAKAKLKLAEKKVARLLADYEGLAPLMAKGYVTKDELDRAALEAEQAEADLAVMRRRVALLGERTYPQARRRAQLQLAQREAQLENAQQRVRESTLQVSSIRAAIDTCAIYAKYAGLVVHEELLGASPRRKIRVGDRVAASQGLVTIPELERMLLETSVRESDLWRVHEGQHVDVSVDAVPSARFTGRVTGVGVLGRSSLDRPFEEKRFDVVVTLETSQRNLRPEMTARASILIAERKRALVVPVSAVFHRNGNDVVYTVGRSRSQPRPVTVGVASDAEVEIVQGLRENERVTLIEPAAAGPETGRRP